jgi:hypothetical protein
MRACLAGVLAVLLLQANPRVDLRVDTSQAEAALAVLDMQRAGRAGDDRAWEPLFASRPHQRLKAREASLKRSLSDEDMRTFLQQEETIRRAPALRRTLEAWNSGDLQASAHRVLQYLPAEAHIRATVYPVIKPQGNSFVYDVRNDPAIFLYLDPDQSAAQFENTVAHELHHIGFASVQRPADALDSLSPSVRAAVEWMGAFGEGFAMLAAAGGPDVHPHAVSPPDVRARWDADMERVNENMLELERFFLDVLDGRLTGQQAIRERAFAFFGEQGPWYTVGYRMAVVIERRYGRETLIACMANPRTLLATYNAAAEDLNESSTYSLRLWSPQLVRGL